MPLKVLFAAPEGRWETYRAPLTAALQSVGIAADLSKDHAPGDVDYIVYAPNGALRDFTPYTRTRAVLCLWAGVETIVTNATLTQPLVRMVDAGLERGMVEWVAGHALRHHLGLDAHINGQDGIWRGGVVPPLAADRPVTVLGLGALGRVCATTLAGIGFNVTGWSRTPKSIPGLRCLSGDAGLRAALSGAEIAVLLLPLTQQTESVMNAGRLALLAPGAVLLNPGRGGLIDEDDLLAALDTGPLGHATLDVFRIEPLPRTHPFWTHPKVTVTPHIASETRPATASRVIAENIRRSEAGQPLLNRVDRALGY